MLLSPLSGCFGEDAGDSNPSENDLVVTPVIPGGEWTKITLFAEQKMSVFIPYFVQDPGSLRAQNSTVLDLEKGEEVIINALFLQEILKS